MVEENKNLETSEEKVDQEKNFESAMKELEEIVNKLEENEVPLEEAIDLFQKGVALSKTCHTKLQKVEDQMDRIMREDGSDEPFSIQEDENA